MHVSVQNQMHILFTVKTSSLSFYKKPKIKPLVEKTLFISVPNTDPFSFCTIKQNP